MKLNKITKGRSMNNAHLTVNENEYAIMRYALLELAKQDGGHMAGEMVAKLPPSWEIIDA